MEFFRIKKDIPFMRHALVFNVISLVTFLLAVFFLFSRGLHLSVEFTGGTLIEVNYSQAANLENIRAGLDKAGYKDIAVQNFGSSQEVMIRLPLKAEQSSAKIGEAVMAVLDVEAPGANLRRVEFVGPQVGKELAENGSLALLLVIVGIVLYLAMRFEWRFSVSAIIANLHDVIIILGFFAFFQWEFSLSVLAAVLAVLGYSVNESVVVFDRVRETFKKVRGLTVPQVLDHAITSTISRTIITHGCTQLMVLSMLLFGGATLHYFALALTIGICFGIYSSVLVAAPLVMWLGVSREHFIKPKKQVEGANEDGAVVLTPGCCCGLEQGGEARHFPAFCLSGEERSHEHEQTHQTVGSAHATLSLVAGHPHRLRLHYGKDRRQRHGLAWPDRPCHPWPDCVPPRLGAYRLDPCALCQFFPDAGLGSSLPARPMEGHRPQSAGCLLGLWSAGHHRPASRYRIIQQR